MFAFARDTTTDLGLILPTWEENVDILNDYNTNFRIIESFAYDPLEFDIWERVEDRVGAMLGGTETLITVTYDDAGNAINFIVNNDLSLYSNATSAFITKAVGDLTYYYLKTQIDTQGEMETIWSVTLCTDAELAAFTGTTNIVTLGTIGTGVWQGTAVADAYVPNNITIELATLATTFTCTDNENENVAALIVFVDGATGAQDAETDGDLSYNPSTGTLSATSFSGDGSVLTGVGSATAIALTIDAKEENTSAIVKGQPLYISGATGASFPKVGLADADVAGKAHVIGIAAEAFSQNGIGLVRIAGVLEGVDTLGANAVNPADETWVAGDILYLSATTGGMTNVEPTVGRVVEIGHSLYGSSNTDTIQLHLAHTHPHIEVAAGEDIILRLGDSAASNKVIIKDYANTGVAFIDSDGKADFTSLTLDTPLIIAEGGTNSGTALSSDFVMISSGGAIVESATITVTELGLLNGLTGIQPLDTALTNISALAYVSPSFIKLTADDTYAVRTLVQVKEDLDLEIGTDVQAYSANTAFRTDKLSAFAATTSAELAGVISDETGTLKLVYSDSPVFTTNISTPNIVFPAGQSASANVNTLDDYEEGEWTIGVAFNGGTTGITYTSNTGYYTKIGNIVTISGYMTLSSKGTSTGIARLTGLPFTVVNNSAGYTSAPVSLIGGISFAGQFQAWTAINTTTIELFEIAENGVKTALIDTDFADNSEIIVGCTYRIE